MGRRLLLPSFIAMLAALALGLSNSRANLYVGYSFPNGHKLRAIFRRASP